VLHLKRGLNCAFITKAGRADVHGGMVQEQGALSDF